MLFCKKKIAGVGCGLLTLLVLSDNTSLLLYADRMKAQEFIFKHKPYFLRTYFPKPGKPIWQITVIISSVLCPRREVQVCRVITQGFVPSVT